MTHSYIEKSLQNLLQNQSTDFHETWFLVSGTLRFIIICSNDDSGLTLTYFMARSNFVSQAFP